MVQLHYLTVHDNDGFVGTLDAAELANPRSDVVVVHTQGGHELFVPVKALTEEADGTLRLDRLQMAGEAAGMGGNEEGVIPRIEETAQVHTDVQTVACTCIAKQVHTQTVEIDEPLGHDVVEVKRVPVNKVIDKSPGLRVDGDTTIVPILEERLVKVLVLKEEVHITRRREERRQAREVTLRREEAVVQRLPGRTESTESL